MAVGVSATVAAVLLADLKDNYRWIKLHTGDPGAAGTANAATETDRVQITETAPAAGAMESTVALEWTAVAGTEDYTHYSRWTASTAGTFGHSGLITADAVTAGNNFTIPSGSHTTTMPLAT